ncbi:Sulfotransferase family protein [Epibacterium ulvae]|uniref:Sulfotransferase family protein n=1 Tax=Epibacterium ulvae TaxID=1156985 RepID=A0A1G5R2V4_9RHOB|nr:sulfotransferase [Epibacterium ulvae]SCZ67649.1 Sulfotransferase family protein [Epibacterium ulvae]
MIHERNCPLKDTPCLIIAGQPKASSTSLFDWLASHPDFRPSRIKEARFFLDPDYPVPSGARHTGSNLERYLDLFPDSGGRILLDASPDYMFCSGFTEVAQLLPRARVILLQRDPVDRLISWYRYAAQRGFLPPHTSFETFMSLQHSPVQDPQLPVWRRALDQNRFDHYAAPILKAFGARSQVVHFDQLRDNPRATLENICDFAGADAAGLSDLTFEARNVTSGQTSSTLMWTYDRLRAKAVYNLPLSQKNMARLRPLSRFVRKLLSRRGPRIERPEIDIETRDFIRHAATR